MKKKAIEKIPYLGLKGTKDKEVKYVGVTAVKIISHEKHMFLEVYKNQKLQQIPVVRIVLAKKDYGAYWPDAGEWTRQKIQSHDYYKQVIWQKEQTTRQQAPIENVLQSSEDMDRIKKFCKSDRNTTRWWEIIDSYEQSIAFAAESNRKEREYKRRQEALQDRMKHTTALPKKRVLEEADRRCFHNKHYLYYKKHGSLVTIACSKCGGVTDARWRDGFSYESQFQRHVKEPKEGLFTPCPMCGAQGEYKCQGKIKGKHSKAAYIFLGQKYKGNGMVMRYMQVEKTWHLGVSLDNKDPEMINAYEEMSGVEIARTYYEPDKPPHTDYHKHNPYTGQDFWDDKNLDGISNIMIRPGMIMPETYKEMKDTIFRYSALQEYAKNENTNPVDYLTAYTYAPQLEFLVKMGLEGVVNQLVKYHFGVVSNKNAKRPDEFLGIQKERVKQLIRKKGNMDFLKIMKAEKRQGQHWTDEQIENLVETGLNGHQIEIATRYMTIQKLLNRIEKYSRCKYGTGRTGSTIQIQRIATTYADYLNMRLELGYDLNNTVYQQPRDLAAAHAEMIIEINKEKMEKHLQEVAKSYPQIQHIYRRLRKTYFYEDDNYIIRPARSAEEIVMEGRILHHCVGGNNYLTKHNTGKTYILMVRFKKKQDIPYVTVEVDAHNPRIIQWYGDKDTKPDEQNVQEWLDTWLTKLKTGALKETA